MTRRRQRGPVGRLLLGCVRGQAWRRGSPRWHETRAAAALSDRRVLPALVQAAHFHGVAGYAQRVLSRLEGADALALADLEAMQAGVLHTHLRALGDLRLLGEALGGPGIPWLVVKGPVLAELHGAPDLRAYSDLDVVVPASAFPDAVEALEGAGARVLACNWWHRRDVLAGEVPLVLPSGTAVDLHWHLLNDRDLRRVFPLRMPELLGRARAVELRGEVVRTLDEVDGLLHLALHTAMSGGSRLVWLKDLERVLLVHTPVPADVVARALGAGLELVVASMLDRIAGTLGTVVPPGLRADLDGSVLWRRGAALARRLSPPERAGPEGSIDRLVTRATRTSLGTSIRELGRRATRRSLRGPGGAGAFLASRDVAGEGAAGRRAFLAAVARSASA